MKRVEPQKGRGPCRTAAAAPNPWRRRALIATTGLAAAAVAVFVGIGPWRTTGIPAGIAAGGNVLLITIDTLRTDRVGAYGSAAGLTPTLDGLAAHGIRFETTFTPVPMTLPAHASILTGLDPPSHGIRNNTA